MGTNSSDWVDAKGRTVERLMQLDRISAGTVLLIGGKEYLVGDVNELMGVCDDCTGDFTKVDIVSAYRQVKWKRGR